MFKMFKLILCFALMTIALAGFKEDCLEAHNKYRKIHSAPDLVLDDTVQASAQAYADTLAATNTFKHSVGRIYGENLYRNTTSKELTAQDVVQDWYKEIEYYKFGKEGFQEKAGHFSQVVWKASRKLGCAIAKSGNKNYAVGHYDPPGNVHGQFVANVQSHSNSLMGNSYHSIVYIILVLNLIFILF